MDLDSLIDEAVGTTASAAQKEEPKDESLLNPPLESMTGSEHTRFSGAIWFEKAKETSAVICGCGGIGSYVAYMFARCSLKDMALYDPDTVTEANLSGQMFGRPDIGVPKVVATARILERLGCNWVNAYASTAEHADLSKYDIVASCFDSMAARRSLFERWLANGKIDSVLIDGRLSAESLQVFCIRRDDAYAIDKYASSDVLFSDAEGVEAPCSYKQTTFMASMIASIMTNLMVNFLSPEGTRYLPLKVLYRADSMTFASYDDL